VYVAVWSIVAGQIHSIMTVNRSFENVAKFKYLGRMVTNQNMIQNEIKERFKFG
jgi:hypothetical protein